VIAVDGENDRIGDERGRRSLGRVLWQSENIKDAEAGYMMNKL
jgi:hypothetical protein